MEHTTEGRRAVERDFDKRWDFDHPDQTERVFREMLEASNHLDLEYDLELQTQIARTLGLQRRFQDALRMLDLIKLRLLPYMDRVRVRYLLEGGRLFNTGGYPDRSKPLFHEAFKIAERIGETALAIDAAHMIGIVEPLEDQISWNERALHMARHATDPAARAWIAPVSNNLGWTYADLGRYDEALKLFKLGAEARHDGPDRPYLIARYAVAHAMRKLGRYREALDILFDLERRNQELGTPAPYVEEELGECLYAVGLQDEAAGHFAQAYEMLKDDEVLTKEEPARLARIKTLGGVCG